MRNSAKFRFLNKQNARSDDDCMHISCLTSRASVCSVHYRAASDSEVYIFILIDTAFLHVAICVCGSRLL